jgi:hypothetical protein
VYDEYGGRKYSVRAWAGLDGPPQPSTLFRLFGSQSSSPSAQSEGESRRCECDRARLGF